MLGRSLPALLSGIVIAAVAVVAVVGLGTLWNSVALDPVGFNDGSIINELVLRDKTTGEYVDYASAEALIPQADPRFAERFTEVPIGLAGTSAPMVVARASAALVGGSATLLVGAFVIANRRKPYYRKAATRPVAPTPRLRHARHSTGRSSTRGKMACKVRGLFGMDGGLVDDRDRFRPAGQV